MADSIRETGLTVIAEPPNPNIDLVFVHGFTGHPRTTWATKRRKSTKTTAVVNIDHSDAVSKPRLLKSLSRFGRPPKAKQAPNPDEVKDVFWPKDLIPRHFADARVLTYGYDTHIRHAALGQAALKTTVYDIASNFLVALEADRRSAPHRPVVFLAHSLGGIVVKEMLRQASICKQAKAHLRSVYDSCRGIIFFGTPHFGADPRNSLRRIVQMLAKISGFSVSEQIVDTLMPTSERLLELRNEFAVESTWKIHSFQEQHVVAMIGTKIVEDSSSCLGRADIEVTEGIGRNHMEMCRFDGEDDAEYRKVALALGRIVSEGLRQPAEKINTARTLTREQQDELLKSLKFEEFGRRQQDIRNPHSDTCQWFLAIPRYQDWLDPKRVGEHLGFLWIKGKAGAGKSTLMNFLLQCAQKDRHEEIIIHFFFHARGGELEKSTTGMYRSLLLQLFEKDRMLMEAWDPLLSPPKDWSVEQLKSLFGRTIHRLGNTPVTCFIDALDECPEDEVRNMVSFLEEIVQSAVRKGTQLRICFSSRPYPNIRTDTAVTIDLSSEIGHEHDIAKYIQNKLAVGNVQGGKKIRDAVLKKANGVFMWVVLVVDILKKEIDHGRSHTLEKKLHTIPADLHGVFRDILARGPSSDEERKSLVLCIQWVLFAERPLELEELYFAIRFGLEPGAPPPEWERQLEMAEVIPNFVLGCSKGLVEIVTETRSLLYGLSSSQSAGHFYVQFIHESVRDFLLQKNGLLSLMSDAPGWFAVTEECCNVQALSHNQLKQHCFDYITAVAAAIPSTGAPTDLPKYVIPSELANRHPFTQYAFRYGFYHGDQAQQHGADQMRFLQTFDIQSYNGALERLDLRYDCLSGMIRGGKFTVLHHLSACNCTNLVDTWLSKFASSEEVQGLGQPESPISIAFSLEKMDIVRALLKAQAEVQPKGSPLRSLYKTYDYRKSRYVGFGLYSLHNVVTDNDSVLLAYLLAAGGSDVNWADMMQRKTYLIQAVIKGFVDIAKLLIDAGATVDARDIYDHTALHYAVEKNNLEMVRLLLYHGAQIDMKDDQFLQFLLWAFVNGDKDMFQLFSTHHVKSEPGSNSTCRDRRVSPKPGRWREAAQLLFEIPDEDSRPENGITPSSDDKVLAFLLSNGADIEARNRRGQTPLLYCLEHRKTDMANLLLENGANVNAIQAIQGPGLFDWVQLGKDEAVIQNTRGLTPLLAAFKQANFRDQTTLSCGIIRTLLDRGAEIEAKDQHGRTSLFYAAGHDSVDMIRLLLDKGADVHAEDDKGQTPLLYAAQYGGVSSVRLLLDRGADTNAKGIGGETSLSYATSTGNVEIVRLSLDNGADATAKDANGRGVDVEAKAQDGRTALSFAAERGSLDVIRLLLDRGASINARDKRGCTPLLYAIVRGDFRGRTDAIHLMISHGADIEAKDEKGRTPLSYAVSNTYNDMDMARFLLDMGANINTRDGRGRTPLFLAIDCDNTDTVGLLLDRGADVNVRNDRGQTPLFFVFGHGCARLLVDKGADINAKDNEGRTPLSVVYDHRVSHLLVEAGADVKAAFDGDQIRLFSPGVWYWVYMMCVLRNTSSAIKSQIQQTMQLHLLSKADGGRQKGRPNDGKYLTSKHEDEQGHGKEQVSSAQQGYNDWEFDIEEHGYGIDYSITEEHGWHDSDDSI